MKNMLKIFLWICCLLRLQEIHGRLLSEKKNEFLIAAGEALDAILRTTVEPWCSMILVTDGSQSPMAVHEVLSHIEPLYGTQVHEVNNRTQEQLSAVISETTRVLKSHKCVILIVATTSPSFLETILGLYAYDLQLVWKQRPILVTNVPLATLKGLIQAHWKLFATSAVVVHVQDAKLEKRWIGIYSHQPFSPQNGGEVIRTASWTPLRGLVTAPKKKIEDVKSDTVCCGETLSVKEALKDPVTMNRILLSPRTFRFEKPVTVVISGEHWPTHIVLNERNQVSGSMGSLLNALSQSLNFSYKIVRPEDGLWGSIGEDGSWSGMVGMVHRHEADMALGPHDITLIRTTAIDYTSPIFTDARQFVLAQNRAEVDPWGFLLPLSPMVWIGALITLGVIALVMITLGRNYRGDSAPTYAMAVFFHTYRLFFAQGFTMKIHLVSERIVVLSWLVGAMIICWSYSTNLMSLLAVRYAPKPVQTIRDLIDDHRLIAIFPRRTALSDYVLSQESGILKEVADLRNVGRYKSLHYNDFAQALETLVRRGDHAIATCTTDAVNIIAKYFSQKGSCNFYIARETFVPFTLAMIVQKGSPLVEPLSQKIRGIVSGGLYRHWLDSNLPNSTSCKHMPSSFTVKEPLAMTNIWGLFVLLTSGLGVACLIFWIEVLLSKSSRWSISE
ncbi:probable glutamate receptor [Palaemon carinicauda]|uniref:probable glutamate receptor n=1 Tax=Palaemon carinicauda TaxID=392227 RepID=UPI0035B5EEB4